MNAKKKSPIKQIIEKSGNDFHLAIAEFLRSKGWVVKISPYYNDPATNKPREIDIIATKEIKVIEKFYNRSSEIFILRLFIECKHLPNPNVLWFVPKNQESAKGLAKDSPILKEAQDWELTKNMVQSSKSHHYLNDSKVMKLGAKTGNSDLLYEAMNGCLNALVFYKENQYLGTSNVINYPVIVVNSFENLHKRNTEAKDGHESITENFQMEVDYSFTDKDGKPKTKYFLLDVVSGEKLEGFLKLLEECDGKILEEKLHSTLLEEANQQNFHQKQNREEDSDPYWK